MGLVKLLSLMVAVKFSPLCLNPHVWVETLKGAVAFLTPESLPVIVMLSFRGTTGSAALSKSALQPNLALEWSSS